LQDEKKKMEVTFRKKKLAGEPDPNDPFSTLHETAEEYRKRTLQAIDGMREEQLDELQVQAKEKEDEIHELFSRRTASIEEKTKQEREAIAQELGERRKEAAKHVSTDITGIENTRVIHCSACGSPVGVAALYPDYGPVLTSIKEELQGIHDTMDAI